MNKNITTIWVYNWLGYYTPWKINMEPKTGGLENDRSFQLRDFLVAISIFWGCRGWQTTQLYMDSE